MPTSWRVREGGGAVALISRCYAFRSGPVLLAGLLPVAQDAHAARCCPPVALMCVVWITGLRSCRITAVWCTERFDETIKPQTTITSSSTHPPSPPVYLYTPSRVYAFLRLG